MSFWKWFFIGNKGKAGWKKFIDLWLILHISVALLLTVAVSSPLNEAANSVLLPLAGILIGLSFAWGGNAQALIQTSEIEDLAKHHPDGAENYVYTFQSAIMILLVVLSLWGIAGLGVFENEFIKTNVIAYNSIEFVMFFTASLALRECWHVVLGCHSLLVIRANFRRSKQNGED